MLELIEQALRRKNALYYWVLIPLSGVFAAIAAFRRWAYKIGLLKSYPLAVPVIVVGNIHVGGSGKTPAVIWLVEQLKKNGYNPAVISRGYGGTAKTPTAVTQNSAPSQVGDEPVLIAQRAQCPVWVGQNRVAVGQALLQSNPQCNVIISDDGLQHYRLKRDIEIAVVGSDFKPDENLLPAGTLREPVSRLKTVDAVINNGHTLIEQGYFMQLSGEQFVNLANPAITATAANFQRQSIKAFAGIGKPARFFDHLRQLGLTFVGVEFADHHIYTAQELTKMGGDVLMMTEKDAVKCQAFAQANYWTLPVSAQIDANLMPLILTKLKQKLGVKKT